MVGDASLVSVVIPSHPSRIVQRSKAVEFVWAQSYPNIDLVVETGGHDRISAKNLGIQRSKGGFVAFLDDDDGWHMDKLVKQMEIMNLFPDVDIVICWKKDVKPWMPSRVEKPDYEIFYKDLLRGFCITNTSAFLVRKSSFDKYGCFDESLRGSEEYELALRFLRNGGRMLTVQEILVFYGVNSVQGTSMSDDYSRRIRAWFDVNRLYGWDMLKQGIMVYLFRVFYNFGWNLMCCFFPRFWVRLSNNVVRYRNWLIPLGLVSEKDMRIGWSVK